jgi:uncharacterized protein YbaR (Trm112 family)
MIHIAFGEAFIKETGCGFSNREGIMTIKKELLDILACPKCKGDIYLNDSEDGLVCDNCKLLYEIRDDIPVMLIDEAKPINP